MGLLDSIFGAAAGASPAGAIAQGVGALISPISKLFLARKQRKMADAINPVRTYYKTSPYAIENKAIAQNQMNGQMPGGNSLQQGIDTAQANTINSGNRNATSSADALAIAAGSQGTANRGYEERANMQNQFSNGALNNVMGANRDLTSEGDKVFQDQYNDYTEKTNAKNALLGASIQNNAGAFQDIGNGLIMGGNALMNAQNGAKQKQNQGSDIPDASGSVWVGNTPSYYASQFRR